MNSETTPTPDGQAPAKGFTDTTGIDLPDDQPGAAQPVSPHAVAVPRGASGEVTSGIVLMLVFALIAPGIDIFAKLATDHVPSAEVAAARFMVQFIALTPIVLWRGGLRGLTAGMLTVHAVRGALIGAATILFITALSHMPIADAIAIFFIEPMVLTLLGGVFLREKVGWRRYLASFVGFVGAMIVVRPSFQELGPVALLPIGTAFCFAVYLILTRRMAAREDPFTMQAFAGWFGMIFVGLTLWYGHGSGSAVLDPVWPNAQGWKLMLGVGAMATISHLFLVYAFTKAPASVLAPLQYLEIASATLFGYLVFGDFPDVLKWLGIAIIVGSGLFIFWRERLVAHREGME